MTQRFNVDTERIVSQLNRYREEFVNHPLFLAAHDGAVPASILKTFATYQYADSILWIPMLALMRAKAVRSERLRRAIESNIACEAGLSGDSHVGLAVGLMRSLGQRDALAYSHETFADAVGDWLSDDFARWSEPEVAGWLLVAESLVPMMFARMMPSFARLPGCETRYFSEHVSVDEDEHSVWMLESVQEVLSLYGTEHATRGVLRGMEEAWDEVLLVPNQLYEAMRPAT